MSDKVWWQPLLYRSQVVGALSGPKLAFHVHCTGPAHQSILFTVLQDIWPLTWWGNCMYCQATESTLGILSNNIISLECPTLVHISPHRKWPFRFDKVYFGHSCNWIHRIGKSDPDISGWFPWLENKTFWFMLWYCGLLVGLLMWIAAIVKYGNTIQNVG